MFEGDAFPLDVEAINKGDTFTPAQLSKLFGVGPRYAEYQTKLIALTFQLRKRLLAAGKPFTVHNRGKGLVVLTDEEANEYNQNLFKSGKRRMRRAHRQLEAVDVARLTDVQRKDWDRAVVIQGAQLVAIEAARREVRAMAYRRQVPGLVGMEN